MAQSLTSVGTLYSAPVGFVFVFNLIVGSGVLAMPRAFAVTGWALSLLGITAIAAIGFLTVTFIVESMAVANALLKLKDRKQQPKRNKGKDAEKTSLLSYEGYEDTTDYTGVISGSGNGINTDSGLLHSNKYSPHAPGEIYNNAGIKLSGITLRVELGQMASMFYPKKYMVVIFYVAMCAYLFGDMAIYSVTITKSIRNVACTYSKPIDVNATEAQNMLETDMCWAAVPNLSRMNAYRIFLAIFTLGFGPFIFFNIQKTKYLQFSTLTSRLVSFSAMIILVAIRLAKGYEQARPEVANIAGLPTLFGVCVYSFMSHHSLPSLVTPIKDKSKLSWLLATDYITVLTLCSTLCVTGLFAFVSIQDIYTLNFLGDGGAHPITRVSFIEYFLALFPVFTLSTNYPLIGITLRNNLKTLGHLFKESYPFEFVLFPLLTIIPPFIVAIIGTQVTMLVSFTGSYAGAIIQYLIPAVMVYYARKQFKEAFGDVEYNRHRSWFTHWFWLLFVTIWFVMCVVFVTAHHVISHCISTSTNNNSMYATITNITQAFEPGPVLSFNGSLF